MNDYVVASCAYNGKQLTAAAFYEDGVLSELQLEDAQSRSWVGTVFAGTVDSVAKNIGGAFISIGNAGKQVNAGVLKMHADSGRADRLFLRCRKSRNPQIGEKVLVQIVKDASGMKEAVCTEHLSFAGRALVLSMGPGGVSFSRKLTEEQRKIISKWLSDARPEEAESLPEGHAPEEDSCIGQPPYHVLVRTNAVRCGKQAVLEELEELADEMNGVRQRFHKWKAAGKTGMVWEPKPFYVLMERDLYLKPDRFFTDLPVLAETDARYEYCPSVGRDLPLDERFSLTRDLNRLTRKTVYLKSGAFLVIEKTEAFVSVDVNTGSCETGRKPEETYRKVNLEAAETLAREMRLRNLSGMILVDFVNLKMRDHQEELLNTMKKLVRKDHIHTDVIDLTPLGIMEIVREKQRKPLAEILS